MNELIFLMSVGFVSIASLVALRLGKEGLTALISVQAVLVNLFVLKQITLVGYTATASDALAVGITLSLNLLQEYYQKQAAQKAVLTSFLCALFYTIMTIFQRAYAPALTDIASGAFDLVLLSMPRIIIASLVTYLIAQMINTMVYGLLQSRFHTQYFIGRNYATLALTSLIDTVLFGILGLYNINESFSSPRVIFDMIVVSYVIKLAVIILAVPFVQLAKKIVRQPA